MFAGSSMRMFSLTFAMISSILPDPAMIKSSTYRTKMMTCASETCRTKTAFQPSTSMNEILTSSSVILSA